MAQFLSLPRQQTWWLVPSVYDRLAGTPPLIAMISHVSSNTYMVQSLVAWVWGYQIDTMTQGENSEQANKEHDYDRLASTPPLIAMISAYFYSLGISINLPWPWCTCVMSHTYMHENCILLFTERDTWSRSQKLYLSHTLTLTLTLVLYTDCDRHVYDRLYHSVYLMASDRNHPCIWGYRVKTQSKETKNMSMTGLLAPLLWSQYSLHTHMLCPTHTCMKIVHY
jgi:hypothetical protein